jgi:hypothetical protein
LGTFRPFQSEALHQHGRYQTHFELGKVLANAHPGAGAEGHPHTSWDVGCTG